MSLQLKLQKLLKQLLQKQNKITTIMKLKKPEVLPDFTSEMASGFLLEGMLIIGVDEVGRGCLAGPVVAGAVALPHDLWEKFGFLSSGKRPRANRKQTHCLFKIKDSKLIPEPERAPLAAEVRNLVIASAIHEASVAEIEELNILYASHLAMERAVEAVEKQLGRKADLVLVDGNIVPKGLKDRGQALIKGDLKSLTIACASILAKVYRDELMVGLDRIYPGYGLSKHKGYATAFHRAQIKALGVTEIHRAEFAGVSEHIFETLEVE